MRNPWLDLPDESPYVLADDRGHVEAFNRLVTGKYRLSLDLLPEPFLGPRDAPLVVLMLNPGLVQGDSALHRANLGDDPEAQRHLGFSSNLAASRWWSVRFRKVIEGGHDLDELSRKVLSVEFHGYRAQNWRPIPVTLPSQHFGFRVVEDALERGATIIEMRGTGPWEVAVPGLNGYQRLVRPHSPRPGAVSPGNLGKAGFEQVLGALE